MKKPKYLYRLDDGAKFTLKNNGMYRLGKGWINEWSYEVLISHGFVDSLSKCKIKKQKKYKTDGHGDGDFDH